MPDLRGRVPGGLKAGDAYFGALGQTGGEATHVLSESELAPHAHRQQYASNVVGPAGGSSLGGMTASGSTGSTVAQQYTLNAGSGAAHNNLQPYLTLTPLIKS